MLAFWIATVYSIYTVIVPVDFQRKMLLTVHIDPSQRLVILGFGLAAFFLYAGFRAWDSEHAIVERTSESATAKQIETLRAKLDEIHSHEWRRLTAIQKGALVDRLKQIGTRTIWIIRPLQLDCVLLAKDFDEVFRAASWDVPNVEPYSPGGEELGLTVQTLMDVGPALRSAIAEATGLPAKIYEIKGLAKSGWRDDNVVLSVGLKSS
jgi:hypothetical protein